MIDTIKTIRNNINHLARITIPKLTMFWTLLFNYINNLSIAKVFAGTIAIPTIISLFYNVFMASDIYISEAKVSVFVEGNSVSLASISPDIGSIINNSQDKDLMAIKEFITSYNLLKEIDKRLDLKNIYSSSEVDYFSRISNDITIEEFLEYFKKMVEVKVHRDASIIHLRARAFTPVNAKRIADEIITITEEFINSSLSEVRKDTVTFARSELKNAEDDIAEAASNINQFQQQNNNFNPEASSIGLFETIQAFKQEKSKLRLEISAMRKIYSDKHVNIIKANNNLQAIDLEIAEISNQLVGNEGNLSDLTDKYNYLQIQNEFTKQRYQVALMSYQQAIQAANRKNKYIITLSTPILPEIAEEPRRLLNILTVLFISFLAVSLISLFVASVRDHVIR